MAETKSFKADCSIYGLIARDGRSATLFRRGPSRQVRILRWWLDDDRLEAGQWLKGRIYERRCDLSPDGNLLVYFAAKWATPLETWTAISRTPYLTALALWPMGGAWGGGGLFTGKTTMGLNHTTQEQAAPSRKFQQSPQWHPLGPETPKAGKLPISVERLWEHAGSGEDNPIAAMRMQRDGWRMIQSGAANPYGSVKGYAWQLSEQEIWERNCPKEKTAVTLRRKLKGVGKRDGRWYDEDFELVTDDDTVRRLLEGCTWADWHQSGDLLFALGGSLYRLPNAHVSDSVTSATENATCVADVSDMTFAEVAPPDWALSWHKRSADR